MKKLIYCLLIACLALPAAAKTKVVEKSAKKVPVWVGATQTDYIVTSAIADDLETAKAQCLDNVRKQIVNAVAQNVSASSLSQISQTSVGSQITSFLDTYSSTMKTQAAPVPYLKGVSASKIEAFYWEKSLDKATGKTSYMYAVKYPFPSVELKELTHQFEKNDKEMWGKYQTLAGEMDKVASLEQIDRAVADLNPVIKYLFDEVRKNAAQSLQQSYQKLYSAVTFRTISNEPGEYRFSLVLDGRPITTSQRIALESNCATNISADQQPEAIVVKYRTDNCSYDLRNEITAKVKIAGKTVPHTFPLDIKKFAVNLSPEKTVYLTATEKDEAGDLKVINARVFFRSGLTEPVTIKSMTLDVPGLSEPLFFDNLDTVISGKDSSVTLTWTGSVKVLRAQNGLSTLLRGNIEVENNSIARSRVDFSLPVKTNW